MKRNTQLGPRMELFIRFVVGLGWVVAGLGVALTRHGYPPGDIRSSQAFWVVLGMLSVAIGSVIVADGIRRLLLLRGTAQTANPPLGTPGSDGPAFPSGTHDGHGRRRLRIGRKGEAVAGIGAGVGWFAVGLLTLLSNLGEGSAAPSRSVWIVLGVALICGGLLIIGWVIRQLAVRDH